MTLAGRNIAMLVDNYVEQAELEVPLRFLEDNGAEVTIISSAEQDIQGLNGQEPGDIFQADLLLDEADPSDYDALVIPGGVVNADKLRMVTKAREWVNDFMDNGKLIAAICHAPWLLVSADMVEGRRLTSYASLQDDVRNAGGEWINQKVVIDNNLITSRQPDDLDDFNKAILAWLTTVYAESEEEQESILAIL